MTDIHALDEHLEEAEEAAAADLVARKVREYGFGIPRASADDLWVCSLMTEVL